MSLQAIQSLLTLLLFLANLCLISLCIAIIRRQRSIGELMRLNQQASEELKRALEEAFSKRDDS